MSHVRLLKVMDGIKIAERKARELLLEFYPAGSEIWWERGRGLQRGNVVNHATWGTPGIRVKNAVTEKTYWIEVGSIR